MRLVSSIGSVGSGKTLRPKARRVFTFSLARKSRSALSKLVLEDNYIANLTNTESFTSIEGGPATLLANIIRYLGVVASQIRCVG